VDTHVANANTCTVIPFKWVSRWSIVTAITESAVTTLKSMTSSRWHEQILALRTCSLLTTKVLS
jgi:hypothetical protein